MYNGWQNTSVYYIKNYIRKQYPNILKTNKIETTKLIRTLILFNENLIVFQIASFQL